MFQPVGGMDRIPYAFAKGLGDVVQYGAPVTEVRKTPREFAWVIRRWCGKDDRGGVLFLRDAAGDAAEDSVGSLAAVPEEGRRGGELNESALLYW